MKHLIRFVATAALATLTMSAFAQPSDKPSADTIAAVNSADVPTLATRPAEAKVLLPVGTAIRMKLDAPVSTRDSKPGDTFSGRVSEDVVVGGKTVIASGSTLNGRVMRLDEPRRITGRPAIQLLPETVTIAGGTKLPIAAVIVDTSDPKKLHVNGEGRIKGPGISQQDKVEFVAASAAGTIAGSVINLGKGTWMGAAAGAAFATGHWLVKRHSLELPAGTELIMEISNPVSVPSTAQPQRAQGGE